jgi:hypothetical protein
VTHAVQHVGDARLLTLTLAASADPLREQLDRLKDCFRRLRRRKQWKRHVLGGIAVVEVTWSARSQAWHPHLHIVLDGSYWAQAAIANEWERVTGDSRICDIRRVPDRRALVRYVAKYVSKSQTPGSLPDRRMVEWCHAIHGLRMAQTFGCLHGLQIDADKSDQHGACEEIASVSLLADRADEGSTRALRLIRLLPHVMRSEHIRHHRASIRLLRRYQRYQDDRPPRYRPPPRPKLNPVHAVAWTTE